MWVCVCVCVCVRVCVCECEGTRAWLRGDANSQVHSRAMATNQHFPRLCCAYVVVVVVVGCGWAKNDCQSKSVSPRLRQIHK